MASRGEPTYAERARLVEQEFFEAPEAAPRVADRRWQPAQLVAPQVAAPQVFGPMAAPAFAIRPPPSAPRIERNEDVAAPQVEVQEEKTVPSRVRLAVGLAILAWFVLSVCYLAYTEPLAVRKFVQTGVWTQVRAQIQWNGYKSKLGIILHGGFWCWASATALGMGPPTWIFVPFTGAAAAISWISEYARF